MILGVGFTSCSVESVDSTENLATANATVLVSAFSITAPSVICAGLPATFTYGAPIRSNLQVQQLVAGEWVQVYHNNKSNNLAESFVLTFGSAGTYSLRYKDEQGFSAPMTVTVVNCNTCEESFSYKENDGGSYTFTYIPEESFSADLVFTFAQGVAVTGLEDWSTNGQTRQITMALTACTEYSWTVTLTPDCSGSSPSSNVFTDFKVNEVSKKGNLNNIIVPCS